METCLRILVAFAAFAPAHVAAVIIDVSYPERDVVRALFLDIDDVSDRVYTLRVDEDGKAEVRFGDGIRGARPDSGGAVVGSYRYGSAGDGKIVNEYAVTADKLPFIPVTDFLPPGQQQPGISFVVAGLTSIQIDVSPAGLRVIDAQLSPAAVPLPATAGLFATALLVLAGFRARHRGS